MNKAWILALALTAGVAGFFVGRHGPRTALQATARGDVEQAAMLFHLAYSEPQQQQPRSLWTSEGMGYLEAAMTPLFMLGAPQINAVAPSVEQAADDVLVTHNASPQQRRLFALFEQEFYTQPQEGTPGTMSLTVIKRDLLNLLAVAGGK